MLICRKKWSNKNNTEHLHSAHNFAEKNGHRKRNRNKKGKVVHVDKFDYTMFPEGTTIIVKSKQHPFQYKIGASVEATIANKEEAFNTVFRAHIETLASAVRQQTVSSH